MWHRQRWAGWIVRVAGVATLALSIGAGGLLAARMHAQAGEADPIDFVLALMAFLAASCGSAMLFLGAHLFDEVKISARWQSLRQAEDTSERCQSCRHR